MKSNLGRARSVLTDVERMTPSDVEARGLPELDFLPFEERISSKRLIALAVASIVIHIIGITAFLNLPEIVPTPRKAIITSNLHEAVHLYLPRDFQPTQKTPNVNKVVTPELDVRSQVEAQQSQAPRYRPPQPSPGPVSQPVPVPKPVEPPKIQVAVAPPPNPNPPSIAPPAPPNGSTPQAPPPPEAAKPKMAFENVAPAPAVARNENGPIDPRLLMHVAPQEYRDTPRSGGGGLTVGDTGDDLNFNSGTNQAPSRGATGSNLQLLSDTNGVDFKPYLLQVLAAIRHNWYANMPDTVRSGKRGKVVIQFIIDRRGGIPKLVIASSSGTEAFDRAAVTGVSASNPFPPLPAEFKGDQIRLELAFSYNKPRQ